jgi:hypothetical protein
MTMSFDRWLDTFLSEKEVDLEETFEVNGPSGINYMCYENVVVAMKTTSSREQLLIQRKIIQIDHINGDVRKYLRHLSQAIAI